MADQPKTISGGSRHCSKSQQGEDKTKKHKLQLESATEFSCRRVTRRSLKLGDIDSTGLLTQPPPPESHPSKKTKTKASSSKKTKPQQKRKFEDCKTTQQKAKSGHSQVTQQKINCAESKTKRKAGKKGKNKSQNKTTDVLYSIARNLRSNSSASIVEGIPYHSVRETHTKSEEHLSAVQTIKPKNVRKRKSSKIDTDQSKQPQECSANPAKKARLNFSVRVQITGDEQVGVKQETSITKSRQQKSNFSLASNSPELDSFRQSSRTKKTGSCASSRSRRASSASNKKRGTKANSQSTTKTTEETSKAQCSNPMSDQDSSENAADRSGRPQSEDATQSAVASSSVSAAAVTSESESEDPDMGRLQALLEARGLPTHLFGSLGPRMHQLLHRTMAGGTMSKVQQLLQGLQTSGDEGQQLTAVIEMCQLLVMGNEDTLAGFPVKQVVPALITLLQMEHNFDMMHHACRALTYMMEALPRSSTVVVDAVPVFLEKLQAIQCMDVAEQSLTALEMLSRRHSKAILQANGISACLMYLDFFGINAQRCALMVTANCVQNMTADEFHYVRDNLPLLSSRLNHQDKKSCESCCLCFAKLVDNFQHDQRILKEIAVHGCLTNIQQLLVVSPPLISSGTFVTVLRMLATMCASCPDLAVVLLKQKIAETLSYLLIGATDDMDKSTQSVELISRSPQELYELVCLIGELLPKLPSDGIFAVDSLMRKGGSMVTDAVTWQWKDDRGMWHSYHLMDNRIIEAAHQANEDEVSLTTMGRAYTIDFNAMQQINEDSGTARTIQRKVNHAVSGTSHSTSASSSEVDVERCDSRAEILKEDDNLASNFMQTLFAVLYEVYSSSAGPTVRHKCLQTLLRMIYYGSADLLREVLKNQPVSSHIAAMMASNDLRVTVGAIQIAQILIEKLPDIFSVVFRREGVFHQIRKLSEMEPQPSPPLKPTPITSSSSSLSSSTTSSSSASSHSRESLDRKDIDTTPYTLAATGNDEDQSSGHQMRLSDVLKRKKRGANRKSARGDDSPIDIGTKGTSGGCGKVTRGKLNSKESKVSGSTPKMSFLPSLNPRTWGSRFGSSSTTDRSSVNKARSGKESAFSRSPVITTTPNNKEKVRSWIKDQASRLLKDYFNAETQGNSHPALSVLNRLSITAEALSLEEESLIQHLEDVAEIMRSNDVSPFEIIHSGLVNKLLQYLTSVSGSLPRELRLRRFLHVFLNCPTPDVTYVKKLSMKLEIPPPVSCLTSKLIGCLHQLEQFQVKVHDLPGGSSANGRGSNAIRFFNTHQIKCNLQRHPSCSTLRHWKGGPVKIDPLALVQAIERYLIMRGYGRLKNEGEDDISEEDNSDEDAEDTMAAMFISQTQTRHRLEFLMGDNLLPYNMTVYQAIKQFNVPSDKDGNETDTDTENPFGNASIWVQTHTIWYRPCANSDETVSTGPKKTKGEGKVHRSGRKKDELWTEGHCPIIISSLNPYLTDKLPVFVTVQDPCLEVIALLRLLYAVNKYWHTLYEVSFFPSPLLTSSEFISSKLTAKANRQLQDPLVIMTGNLPAWLAEIANAAPFLFPFDTRQLLFYATTFDRDRAMMRLQDNSMEPSSNDNSERVSLRLEKRKRTVNRTELLKQAEKVMDEIGTSRALLEIQYENEVGTGLGPTLEFYALVSRDVQRVGLEMWRGDVNKNSDYSGKDSSDVSYINSPSGLFPAPLGRTAKASLVNRLKCKFKFLGKFMAKALMDSRMIDIPFSIAFYKWLLGQEHNLSSSDLHYIDAVIAKSFSQLEEVLRQKKRIEADKTHTDESRRLALASLSMDGCGIEDLDLDFTFPGYPNIELKKGGKDICVTLENLEEYLQLVAHWTLVEGVSRQFEAFRDGFDSVFPLATLQCFYPEELDQLFCGNVSETWDIKMLMECCRPDHGYNHDSKAVKFLFEILNSYTGGEQRAFLQFTTGSPRLPVGGFRSLNPPLTIVRKTFEATENADSFLPSVMTCVNYLKLPDYSTIEVMRDKLSIATREGQLSFHLS